MSTPAPDELVDRVRAVIRGFDPPHPGGGRTAERWRALLELARADVSVARIHRKFGVEVDTALPVIPYRETITATAQAEGKHKKQSGGRGQFGVAFV